MQRMVIEQRFCGPPGCAHGGYLSGLLARHSDRQLRVRLLQPMPLQRAAGARTRRGRRARAQAAASGCWRAACRTSLDLAVPAAPDYLRALEASRNFIGFTPSRLSDRASSAARSARAATVCASLPARCLATDLVAADWVPDASLSARRRQGAARVHDRSAGLSGLLRRARRRRGDAAGRIHRARGSLRAYR